MRRRLVFAAIALPLSVCVAGLSLVARQAAPPPRRPGLVEPGITQLPNGWRIAPAGRHAQVGDLPLNMVWSPDGRYLLITNNGWAKPSITVFDTANFFIQSTLPIDHAWLGLAWHPDGKRLYSSGAAQNVVNELTWSEATLKVSEPIVIGKPVLRPTFETLKDSGFVGGVSVSPDGNHLYAVQVFGSAVSMIDPVQRKVERTAHLSAEPYSTLVSADGKSLFVSLWGGAKLLVLDAATLELQADVRVGEHPNAMVLSSDGTRLFVACANTNAVWAVDLATPTARPSRSASRSIPNAPPGTTPNALGLSPDGKTLLVANADNNTVAVVDVAAAGASRVRGFIPDRLVSDGRARSSRTAGGSTSSAARGCRRRPTRAARSRASRGATGQYIGDAAAGRALR